MPKMEISEYRIASLVRQGYTDQEVANALSCSRSTILRARKSLGLKGYEKGKRRKNNDPIYIQISEILGSRIDIGTTDMSKIINKKPQYIQYLLDSMATLDKYAELLQKRKIKLIKNKHEREIRQAKSLMRRLYKNKKIQPILAKMVREQREQYPDSIFWSNFPVSASDPVWTYTPEAPVFVPFMGAKKMTQEQALKTVAVEFAIDTRHSWCVGLDTELAKQALATAKEGTLAALQQVLEQMFISAGWIGTDSREGIMPETEDDRANRRQQDVEEVDVWVGEVQILEESTKSEETEYISEDAKRLQEIYDMLNSGTGDRARLLVEAMEIRQKIQKPQTSETEDIFLEASEQGQDGKKSVGGKIKKTRKDLAA